MMQKFKLNNVLFTEAEDHPLTGGSEPSAKAAAHPLDEKTGGVFSAPTSGERAARLRTWLATQPDEASMQEVYKELNVRDRGAAKALREKLDELRRSKGQEAIAQEWASKAQALLDTPKLNVADALAWQRDAAKAGAPLSKEPLAGLRAQLTERLRVVEDLQIRSQVQHEAAMLLAQRIEVFSIKGWKEADAAEASVQADVQHWRDQVQALEQDPQWGSVNPKHANQLNSAADQLQLVVNAFHEALVQTRAAEADVNAPLPNVPAWADEIRTLRGEGVAESAEDQAASAEKQAELAQRKEKAVAAVSTAMANLDKEMADGHSKNSVQAAQALRNAIKEHRRFIPHDLEGKVHAVLAAAGELEGWQRWRADQIRQELVQKAEALIEHSDAPAEAAEPAPAEQPAPTAEAVPEATAETAATAEATPSKAAKTDKAQRPMPTSKLSPRKLQEQLRGLREQWKLVDQGGVPNHGLWRRFDAACNEAYRIVEAWLANMKEQQHATKSARQELLQQLKDWAAQHSAQVQEGAADWKNAHRDLLQFGKRWRESGRLSDKLHAEMQPKWKAALHEASQHLETAQKASVQLRHSLIEEARALGEEATLRIDAIKALQHRWQQEAQNVPLERRQEQKLWETFRKPIDDAFQRKSQQREQAQQATSAHDQKVLDAARALEEANASGNAAAIQAALVVLEQALKGRAQAEEAAQAAAAQEAAAEAPAVEAAEETNPDEPRKPAATASIHKPAIAVRGDDRPRAQAGAAEPAARRDGKPARDGKPGRPERGERPMRGERPERGPRLGDAAFRAQRHAIDHAQMALRKLSEQAHGVALTQLLEAWEKRQADLVPLATDLGKKVPNAQRTAWANAITQPAKADGADTAMLRLEIASDVPTPAAQLSARRMLQLQMLTRRNDPSPQETWTQDVQHVLAAPYDANLARRLQQTLKVLLRK